ncbi:dihydrofolate reductase [Hathewaya limosa]|uniref:Dihydrofolate reductase n=1 Tax=Hathewaya limosa TaxID=1536 RepID=A0ABU0JTW9_HATLI|nr:dihydrofolate reductase [Hathewaya limosa]MDQ0480544.1 dihydrofolate reductase [Hathewaya limosa]
MLSIIVAIGNNNVIGRDNSLIWHLPNDLKHFKSITMNKKIIMGRKTFESLPGILKNREHVVITNNSDYKFENKDVKILHSIKDLSSLIEDSEEHFVIGGGEIYKTLLPFCKKLYITRIYEDFTGDTFFPEISNEDWILTNEIDGIKDEKNIYNYKYLIYTKVSNK